MNRLRFLTPELELRLTEAIATTTHTMPWTAYEPATQTAAAVVVVMKNSLPTPVQWVVMGPMTQQDFAAWAQHIQDQIEAVKAGASWTFEIPAV